MKQIYLLLTGEDEHKFPRSKTLLAHFELLRRKGELNWEEIEVIVTGYSGWNWKQANTISAEVVSDFLIKNGVPENKIRKEEEAIDTLGNMVFSYPIVFNLLERMLSKNEEVKLILVTEGFHMKRSRLIFDTIYSNLLYSFPNLKFDYISAKSSLFDVAISFKTRRISDIIYAAIKYDINWFHMKTWTDFERYLKCLPVYREKYSREYEQLWKTNSKYAKQIGGKYKELVTLATKGLKEATKEFGKDLYNQLNT
ncbi:MAG: YdcF family protein [Nanoarchaeota archaeon]